MTQPSHPLPLPPAQPSASAKKCLLIILDGFGIAKPSPFNAVLNGAMPYYRSLLAQFPHSQLLTHGPSVGLPEGVMGNSEVGHMTLGAGRVLHQDLTRIQQAIEDQQFFKNQAFLSTFAAARQHTGRVHLLGLLSDAGVHSHLDHLLALLDLAVLEKIPAIWVHAILDGRDTPPGSASLFLTRLLQHPSFHSGQAKLASLMGRYWAMDRDQRWERTEAAYDVLTGGRSRKSPSFPHDLSPFETLRNTSGASHPVTLQTSAPDPQQVPPPPFSSAPSEEFLEPVLLAAEGAMRTGDGLIFFNFRSDRARQISQALTDPKFLGFKRKVTVLLSQACGMTQYDRTFQHLEVAFLPSARGGLLGEWLSQHGLTQLRLAETEKYAHVTFFFNGGQETPFPGEDRLLIPSVKAVATYDQAPEMSAKGVATQAVRALQQGQYAFILINFANADMLGHTGNYPATCLSLATLDQCLKQVIETARDSGYATLLTADHGNAEEMQDAQGRAHTQHTLNPVPIVFVPPAVSPAPSPYPAELAAGSLIDVMPTVCHLLGLTPPSSVTGQNLLRERVPALSRFSPER